MSRVKTFDATGVAPNGVFFAGDANAIQDHYADLANAAQTILLGTLQVVDTSLQIVKYGTGEFRMTGAMRTDGILRGLSGVAPGIYTTAQRDAIIAGQRPQGMMIFNSTTFQIEVNKGTDAVPSWVGVGYDSLPVGTILPYTGAEGSVPAGFGIADGATISRTTYASLNALYSSQGYPFGGGDGSTTFNKPDLRGRSLLGRDNMGGTSANRVPGVNTMGANGGASTVALVIGEIPSHSHSGVTGSAGAHTHSGATGASAAFNTATESAFHGHSFGAETFWHGNSGLRMDITFGGSTGPMMPYTTTVATGNEDANHVHQVPAHTHPISSDGAHTHTVAAEGGGGAHNNMHPYLAVNHIVKLL